MSPKEGVPIERNPPKPYQLWRLYVSGKRCELLAEGDTREELKFKGRKHYRTALYYKGERIAQEGPPR